MLLIIRIASVVLCMSAFQFALSYELANKGDVAADFLGGFAVLIFLALVFNSTFNSKFLRHLTDSFSLLLIGASVFPTLGTLTSSYSSNTVSFLTHLAYLIHLYTSDNQIHTTSTQSWDSPVSFNAAFTSVLLQASRFDSSWLSFAFTSFSTAVLVFMPKACTSSNQQYVSFVCVFSASISTYVWLGFRKLCMFLGLVIFVHFVAPFMLSMIPHDKLHGPWDILKLEEVREDDE